MKNIKNIFQHKYIVVLRHGERVDKVGLIPKIHKFDPEMTEKGKSQANSAGELIKKYFCEKLKINFKDKKIALISSPFARTLQTAKQIQIVFTEKIIDKIYINNLLCENICDKYDILPSDFLAHYRNCKILSTELEGIQMRYLNDINTLPNRIETSEDCQLRMNFCLDNLKELLQTTLKEYDVAILVCHASPIDYINQYLGHPGPFGWDKYVKYCSSFVYSINTDDYSSQFITSFTPE